MASNAEAEVVALKGRLARLEKERDAWRAASLSGAQIEVMRPPMPESEAITHLRNLLDTAYEDLARERRSTQQMFTERNAAESRCTRLGEVAEEALRAWYEWTATTEDDRRDALRIRFDKIQNRLRALSDGRSDGAT